MMEAKHKICCIGANLESFECLRYLVDQGCSIHTLITLPSGQSKHVSDYYDLHDFCKIHKINVLDTTNVNSDETIQEMKKIGPDYLFTLGWSQIFKADFIACFSKFVVGTHPSKLPHGRGRAPLPWTILEDLRTSAVSFFKIDTGVDTGKLIFQREFDIPPRTYVKDLYSEVAKQLGLGFHEIYKSIIGKESITFSTQDEKGVTIRGKRTPADGLLEFDKKIGDIEKLIRAVAEPFPGAYCYYKEEKIVFWEVEFDEEDIYFGTLGQILQKNKKGILVQFFDGKLWLNRPSHEKGNAKDLKFFRIGDKLGYSVQDAIFKLSNSHGT
ncbi:methionyl-tRNA formyltransferase [Pricia antarctica]|nr:formyltransferase family protein [Pricia antarctica]